MPKKAMTMQEGLVAEPRGEGLARFLGRDVEIRAGHGTVLRGELVAAGKEFLTLRRHSDGRREVIVPVSSLVAILDEQRPLPLVKDER